MGSLLALVNERFLFPAVDHRFRFVLLTLHKGGQTTSLRTLFRLNIQNAVAPADLAALFANLESTTLELRVADIRRFSPDSLSLMEFKSQREVDIAAAIYDGHPLLGEEVKDVWNVGLTTEFHMTNDSRYLHDETWLNKNGFLQQADQTWVSPDGTKYLPLFEGKMIHQFTADFAPAKSWIEAKTGYEKLQRTSSISRNRAGFRGVARSTDARTLIAAMIPAAAFGEALLPLVDVEKAAIREEEQAFILAILNSFVADWILRMKVSARISNFHLLQLPVPRLTIGDTRFDMICLLSQALVSELASGEKASGAERARLRAEIDAAVADLYGLATAEFAYILTTFPLLDRDQPALPGEAQATIPAPACGVCDCGGARTWSGAGADITRPPGRCATGRGWRWRRGWARWGMW